LRRVCWPALEECYAVNILGVLKKLQKVENKKCFG
jgi:hypothetical protein